MTHPHPNRRAALAALNAGALSLAFASAGLRAQGRKIYGPGVTDMEILIGQTMPYSGPVSALSIIGKTHAGYFQMINDRGGVNGRMLKLISLDDGYSPPRALEQTRRLVEQDKVAAIFGVVGTPTNAVIQKYLNTKKVPQLFISGAGARFFDPKNSPWTISGAASLRLEAVLHAKYLLKERPAAKIAVLYQNDDYGKDYLSGLNDGLGDKAAKMVVSAVSYEATDPTVDSQVISLKSSGADVVILYCSAKASSQSIRRIAELGWKPTAFLATGSRSISTVLTPAGLDNAVDVLSLNRFIDLEDPEVAKQPELQEYFQFLKRYVPDGHPTEAPEAFGYMTAYLLVQTLKNCGDELTSENILKQATSLKNLSAPFLLPGASISTSATDYEITKKMIFSRFDGRRWVPLGQPIGL